MRNDKKEKFFLILLTLTIIFNYGFLSLINVNAKDRLRGSRENLLLNQNVIGRRVILATQSKTLGNLSKVTLEVKELEEYDEKIKYSSDEGWEKVEGNRFYSDQWGNSGIRATLPKYDTIYVIRAVVNGKYIPANDPVVTGSKKYLKSSEVSIKGITGGKLTISLSNKVDFEDRNYKSIQYAIYDNSNIGWVSSKTLNDQNWPIVYIINGTSSREGSETESIKNEKVILKLPLNGEVGDGTNKVYLTVSPTNNAVGAAYERLRMTYEHATYDTTDCYNNMLVYEITLTEKGKPAKIKFLKNIKKIGFRK